MTSRHFSILTSHFLLAAGHPRRLFLVRVTMFGDIPSRWTNTVLDTIKACDHDVPAKAREKRETLLRSLAFNLVFEGRFHSVTEATRRMSPLWALSSCVSKRTWEYTMKIWRRHLRVQRQLENDIYQMARLAERARGESICNKKKARFGELTVHEMLECLNA